MKYIIFVSIFAFSINIWSRGSTTQLSSSEAVCSDSSCQSSLGFTTETGVGCLNYEPEQEKKQVEKADKKSEKAGN